MKLTKKKKSLILISSILATTIICTTLFFVFGGKEDKSPQKAAESSGKPSISDYNIKEKGYLMTYASKFSNGVAWVKFKDDEEKEKYGLIDTVGNILYETATDYLDFPTIDNGLSCVQSSSDVPESNKTYTLIDNKGKVISKSKGELFDSVLALGDGLALTYQFIGPDDSNHYYRIIDLNGKTLHGFNLSDKFAGRHNGCGMFSIGTSYRSGILLNGRTGKTKDAYLFDLPEDYDEDELITGFNLIFYDNSASLYDLNICFSPKADDEFIDKLNYYPCTIDTDFNITEHKEYEYTKCENIEYYQYFKIENPNGDFEFYDATNDKHIVVEGYNCYEWHFGKRLDSHNRTINYFIRFKKLETDENNQSVLKEYLFITDKDGKKLCEPFPLENIAIAALRTTTYPEIIPIRKDTASSYMTFGGIMDYDGKILFKTQNYDKIGVFTEEGLAAAYILHKEEIDNYYYEYHYINTKGEIVI